MADCCDTNQDVNDLSQRLLSACCNWRYRWQTGQVICPKRGVLQWRSCLKWHEIYSMCREIILALLFNVFFKINYICLSPLSTISLGSHTKIPRGTRRVALGETHRRQWRKFETSNSHIIHTRAQANRDIPAWTHAHIHNTARTDIQIWYKYIHMQIQIYVHVQTDVHTHMHMT